MITNVQLEEFRKILDFFDSEEKFDIDAYNKFVEEPKVFFKLLSSFDRKKIAKILSENKNKKKKKTKNFPSDCAVYYLWYYYLKKKNHE